MQVSEHFTLLEFLQSQYTIERNITYKPCVMVINNIHMLAQKMEYVRELAGNIPLIITSGYRSHAHNAYVGGSPTSAHIQGLACDFTIEDKSKLPQLAYKIRRSEINYDQLILYDNCIHFALFREMRHQFINNSSEYKDYREVFP